MNDHMNRPHPMNCQQPSTDRTAAATATRTQPSTTAMTSTPHSMPAATSQQHNDDSDDHSHQQHDALLTIGKHRNHYDAHFEHLTASNRQEVDQ